METLLLNNITASIAGIATESTVDGDGVRLVIFFQGCPHKCEGCHNPDTWKFSDHDHEVDLNLIFTKMESLSEYYDGITLSGGEPFAQEEAAYLIAKHAHKLGLTVWTYTGYLYEDLVDKHPLIKETDVLVDGPFDKDLRTGLFAYIGSSNQRIFDLKEMRRRISE